MAVVLPPAPPLPYLTRTNLRAANVLGTIASETEIADVARAQRQVRTVLQEQSEQAVKVANAKAAVMARMEMVEVAVNDDRIHHHHDDDDNYYYCHDANNNNINHGEEWTKKKMMDEDEEEKEEIMDNDDDITLYGNPYPRQEGDGGKKRGGYEVRQYNVSEYDTKGQEYEVSEYKSVYD